MAKVAGKKRKLQVLANEGEQCDGLYTELTSALNRRYESSRLLRNEK